MPRENSRSSRRDDDDDRGGRGGGGRSAPSKGKGGFTYRARSSEEVNRRAKQSSGRYDSYLLEDMPWFKPKEGENCIRLMPWLNGSDPDFEKLDEKWGNHWGIDIIVHRNVGADKGTYLCLDKMNGEPCPMCDVWRSEDAEALKPSDRVLAWVIDRNDEKAGPQLWAMPLGTSKDFSAASSVRGQDGVLLIDDPEEGYDMFFDREGQKKLTRYVRITADRSPSPLHENEKKQNQWLDFVAEKRLPDLLKFYEPEYLDKVLSGQISSKRDDDDDADERPSRRGREEPDGDAPRSRRARRDDPPEDDDPPARDSRRGREEPPEEDADPPARGARGSRRSRSEEADAEPSPPRRSSRGQAAEPDEDPDAGDPPARGGRTERYRGKEPDDDAPAPRSRRRAAAADDDDIPFEKDAAGTKDDDDDDEAAARARLKNVGSRRSRR